MCRSSCNLCEIWFGPVAIFDWREVSIHEFPPSSSKRLGPLWCVLSNEHKKNDTQPAVPEYVVKLMLVTTVRIKCHIICYWQRNWFWRKIPSLLYSWQLLTWHTHLLLTSATLSVPMRLVVQKRKDPVFIQRRRLILISGLFFVVMNKMVQYSIFCAHFKFIFLP